MVGEWQDFAIHPDGRRELIAEGRNLVVNNAHIVLAMVMKQDPSYGGFLYWAVGDGNMGDSADTPAWDAGVEDGSIAPNVSDTQLAREIYRKAIQPSDIVFIDAAGNISATPTNRLQISLTFNEDEPYNDGTIAYFREWGLYGGDATGTLNSGYLINRKVHKTYEKTNVSKLERVLRFTF